MMAEGGDEDGESFQTAFTQQSQNDHDILSPKSSVDMADEGDNLGGEGNEGEEVWQTVSPKNRNLPKKKIEIKHGYGISDFQVIAPKES